MIAVLGLSASVSLGTFFLPLLLSCARGEHPLAVELVEQLLLPIDCVTWEWSGVKHVQGWLGCLRQHFYLFPACGGEMARCILPRTVDR